MILVVLVVGILVLIIGGWLFEDVCWEMLGGSIAAIGAVVIGVSVIGAVIMGYRLTGMRSIDEKIAMYSEENTKIESQLAEAVEQYQVYETNVFQSVAPESAVTLVALYPELKTDTLVQAQMDVYVANNAQIKELKLRKLNEPIYRWWLYFGR